MRFNYRRWLASALGLALLAGAAGMAVIPAARPGPAFAQGGESPTPTEAAPPASSQIEASPATPATATETPSATASPTSTLPSSNSETVTPTDTGTPTATASFPPTDTGTANPSETSGPTDTATLQPTETGTATPTGTSSPTPTTATETPSATEATSPTATTVLPGNYTPDEVLVKFEPGTAEAVKEWYVDAFGAQVDEQLAALGVMVLKVPAGKVSEVVAGLNAAPDVEYAEPNYIIYALDTTPNDPSWGVQYGPRNIQGPQAWDITTGSSSVIIAVVDTGVDLSNPDLAAKIVAGYDFVNSDSSAQDDNGHGTHVAGIAAAVTNNGVGIAGISWGARIMPVKVLDSSGSGTYDQVASGITWAADNGAKVINLSLGGSSPSSVLENAVNYAYSRGVTVVAAAGNSGNSTPSYPGAYPNAVAVAATDSSNNRASFSTYGSFVDIAAPGVSIYATVPTGSCSLCDSSGYRYLSGTSMATPHVAGVAAIMAGLPQFDTPAKIRTAIESTALDLGTAGWDQYYGYGLVQLRNALLFDPANITPTATYTPSLTPTATAIPQTYYYARSDTCPAGVTYSWVDATIGTNTNLHEDDNFTSIALPFAFTLNGQAYTTAYISTNGFISFDSGSTAYANQSIPTNSAPNEFAAPFWDDLNPYYGGNIFYTTVGSTPNRRFVVEWNSVPRYPADGALTFEAILVEGTNEIVFQYNSLVGASATGTSATIGVEYAGGTSGKQFSYNTADAVAPGLAIKFAPAAGATPTPAPTCTNTPTPTPTNTPTPTFTPSPTPTPLPCYTLTVLINPPGSGTVSVSSSNCAGGKYTEGTVVELTASPASNFFRFTSWSGDAGGTANPTSATMIGDKTVTANFEQATFTDVPFDHSLWAYIQALWNGGYTAGCNTNPLMFCPDTILNRAQSAVFVLRGQYSGGYQAPDHPGGTFSDDWSPGTWAIKWAEKLWADGLTAGCNVNPRLYCPWQQHTRAEASVFYLRIKYGASYVPPAAAGTLLGDVTDPNVWYAKWVEKAYTDGLLPACGTDGSGKPLYCPNDLLSRAWSAYMLVQAKNLPLPP